MKKLLSLLFVFILFCLSSCATTTEPPDNHIPSQNIAPTTNPTPSNANAERKTLTFLSLEEYHAAIEMYDLPKNFVTYEDIASFGDFYAWRLSESLQSYGYKFYEGDFSISLYISHAEPTLETTNILPLNANMNLRVCPGTSEGIEKFTHNGITYTYVKGNLYSVKWMANQVSFELQISTADSKNTTFACFDLDSTSTAINALLNKDTAGSVKLAFDNMMAQKAEAAK